MQLDLEIFGFKGTYWLGIFWGIYKESGFSQECSFCNIKKRIMTIILSQKTLNHRNGYLAKTIAAIILEYF